MDKEKFKSHYGEECGSIESEEYDFDFNFDFNEIEQCFTNEPNDIDNDLYEKGYEKGCEDGYEKGYTDGYEKAKQEVLHYMKKNKCYIKNKRTC